jgi:hypothetical protein
MLRPVTSPLHLFRAFVSGINQGLDHGVGHFRLLSITRQRHYEHCNEP